jgi:hypothetical protein
LTLPDRPARRRFSSRKVVLTAAFLALAAGGTAACDASPDESDPGGYDADSTVYTDTDTDTATADTDSGTDSSSDVAPEVEETNAKQVFYCADDEGVIVEAANCADDDTGTYLLWHSTGYARGLPIGTRLNGGGGFLANDRDARRAYRLPATGAVRNGTVKTNVVGQSSTASAFGDGTSGGG